MANAYKDGNAVSTLIASSSADGFTPVRVYADPVTHRLLIDNATASGTVTSVSVATANGFAGSVATPTTTPAITLSTTASGVLKGDGTAISAASASTDYAAFAFKTIAVSGQSDVVADSPIDTLTLVGSGITITTNATTDTVTFTAGSSGLTVGTTAIASGTTTRILYDNAGVLGEYTLTGSGTVVAMQTAPTFATSITTPSVLATANDSGALGASGTAFSDLFLASGAVINFAANNSAITHSSGILTVTAGELRVTSANVGTNADSVPTLSSTSTLTNKTLTSPTLTTPSAFTTGGTITLAENTSIALDPAGSADGKYTGIRVTGTAGYTQAFGDLVYLDPTDSRWEAADANSAAGADGDARGLLAIVVSAGTDGNPCTLLLNGIVRADAKFPTFTVNNPVYVSETAGSVTQTQPTTTDVVIRIVGAALTTDEMYFNPDFSWITHT